jgi:hypothetical protein
MCYRLGREDAPPVMHFVDDVVVGRPFAIELEPQQPL